jgi:DNA gyrase subunit A
MSATNGKTLLINSAMIPAKDSRSTQGVKTMSMKGKNTLYKVEQYREGMFVKADKYKTKNIPAAGSNLKGNDKKEKQISLF